MKIIISSSRTMIENPIDDVSIPVFLKNAEELINELKNKRQDELFNIWKCSKNQFEKFTKQLDSMDLSRNLTKAIDSYNGVVFRQFSDLLDKKEYREYLENHLFILSALYGLLKPNDGIREYHLEMASSFRINNLNLYKYWNNRIHDSLNDNVIINLASEEYAKCVRNYLCKNESFIDIDFVEIVNGQEKKISTEMKKARGLFLRYMIINNINEIELLKDFNLEGYEYDKNKSCENRLMFVKR